MIPLTDQTRLLEGEVSIEEEESTQKMPIKKLVTEEASVEPRTKPEERRDEGDITEGEDWDEVSQAEENSVGRSRRTPRSSLKKRRALLSGA